jgi:hypothetical protein
MSVDSWFRRYCFFAFFPLPFFRLRHVFGTPSDRLRDRSGKAVRLSNLRSDSPLNFVHVGRSYLYSVGVSNGSSTSGSLSVSYVVLANGALGCYRYRFIRASTGSGSHRALWSRTLGQLIEYYCRGPQLLIRVLSHVRTEQQSVSGTCSAPIRISLGRVRTIEHRTIRQR